MATKNVTAMDLHYMKARIAAHVDFKDTCLHMEQLFHYRKKIALKLLECNDDKKQEELMELFELAGEQMKNFLGI